MDLLGWYLLLFVLAFVNLIIGNLTLRAFLAQHASISTRQILEEFKQQIRRQMYQALNKVNHQVILQKIMRVPDWDSHSRYINIIVELTVKQVLKDIAWYLEELFHYGA